MSFQFLKVEETPTVWTVKISRPEALNALNQQVLKELMQLLEKADAAFPKSCRAIILTGEGEKAFVAGADIKELNALSSAQAFEFAQVGQKILRKIEKISVPVVAAVNGFALGGGFELALACDWIYASENAKFGLPEVSLGLIPGFGGTVRLARIVGTSCARNLVLSGEMLTAARAAELGIALKVVPQAELLSEVRKNLDLVLSRAPLGVARAKKAVLETFDVDIDQAMRIEAVHFSDLFASKDMKEGTGAFLEKRKPSFIGE